MADIRLIDANALEVRLEERIRALPPKARIVDREMLEDLKSVVDEIKDAEEIDAQPVRHGDWITVMKIEYRKPFDTWIEEACSLCGCHAQRYDTQPKNRFCPGCGARMDAQP